MKRTLMTCILAAGIGILGGLTLNAYAQEAEAAAAPQKTTLFDLIAAGGWAMWPLGALSFAMIAMATINYQKVSEKKLIPQAALGQIKAAADQQNARQVYSIATNVDSLFTNALAAGLRKFNLEDPAESKHSVEDAISEAVSREESQIGFWINFLSLIAAVSPMVGLLGTVSGMIGAFQKIGAGGMGKPELLAGDIGQALITTATGLIIAIPAMFFFFLFRNSLNRLIQKAEEEFSYVLDDLTGTGMGLMDAEDVEEVEG